MVGRNRQLRAALLHTEALCTGRWWRKLATRVRPVVILIVLVSSAAMASAHPNNLQVIGFADLSGWRDDDHGAALATFQRSCGEILQRGGAFARSPAYGGERADWLEVCRRALAWQAPARQFFESEFVPVRVFDPERPEGLFTGYFEPEVRGSRVKGGRYQVPIYRRPPDLEAFDAAARQATGLAYGRRIGNRPAPYYSRKEIETGALAGQNLELVWLTDWADAFFLQIQGSGRVRLEDGSLMRVGFAAKTGLPYTAVGGILARRGDIPLSEISMQSIREWMARHPDAARELMWQNQSYVFFREIPASDPALGPPGAQQVALTPLRSLAIDRAYWAFGTPIWLDAVVPSGPAGALQRLRHLLIAQDTGSAIKGRVRGDVFWGTGETAAIVAGHMQSPGEMVALLPKAVAARLGLARQ
jgi:membrane-bound lytic murein transglycosylase A